MPHVRQISVSRRNVVWFALVVLAAAIAWLVSGWQLALGAVVVVLIISEIVERMARNRRATSE